MIDFVPYGFQRKYPHMAPNDVAIWEQFLRSNPDAFDRVAYDVAVGKGAEFDTVVNPATGGDAGRLYQRRIDVVGEKDGVIWIIEVKPRASTAALGQVRGYTTLFRRDFPQAGDTRPMLLTDALVPEMEFLAKEDGVRLVVV